MSLTEQQRILSTYGHRLLQLVQSEDQSFFSLGVRRARPSKRTERRCQDFARRSGRYLSGSINGGTSVATRRRRTASMGFGLFRA